MLSRKHVWSTCRNLVENGFVLNHRQISYQSEIQYYIRHVLVIQTVNKVTMINFLQGMLFCKLTYNRQTIWENILWYRKEKTKFSRFKTFKLLDLNNFLLSMSIVVIRLWWHINSTSHSLNDTLNGSRLHIIYKRF